MNRLPVLALLPLSLCLSMPLQAQDAPKMSAEEAAMMEAYQKAGFFVVGLDMDGDVDLPELDLATEPLVIVVGSEGKGLSRLVRETCDRIVSIPMVSSVESLNAGIATGVALYEVARARRIASRGR